MHVLCDEQNKMIITFFCFLISKNAWKDNNDDENEKASSIVFIY